MSGFKKFYQAPLPAVIALLIVYIWQGLGHTVMYLMEHRWFPDNVTTVAIIGGFIGAALVWIGRNKSENAATLLGFLGGSLIWLTWIEFNFVYTADQLGVQDVMWGAKPTKGEYRVMLSSIGVMMASLMYFFYNKDTRCNLFMWLHRNLHLNPGDRGSVQQRNIAGIVALETIYVTWFCYIWLLLCYDPDVLGTDHWFTFASVAIFAIWAAYLIQRLWWFQRMAPALRYAIPTAIIAYNINEILEKWGKMTEIWVQPEKYAMEIGLVLLALIVVVALAILSPARRIAVNKPSPDAQA